MENPNARNEDIIRVRADISVAPRRSHWCGHEVRVWRRDVRTCSASGSGARAVKCRPPTVEGRPRPPPTSAAPYATAECRRQDRPSGLSSSDPRASTSPFCRPLSRLVCAIENRHALRIFNLQTSVGTSVGHSFRSRRSVDNDFFCLISLNFYFFFILSISFSDSTPSQKWACSERPHPNF